MSGRPHGERAICIQTKLRQQKETSATHVNMQPINIRPTIPGSSLPIPARTHLTAPSPPPRHSPSPWASYSLPTASGSRAWSKHASVRVCVYVWEKTVSVHCSLMHHSGPPPPPPPLPSSPPLTYQSHDGASHTSLPGRTGHRHHGRPTPQQLS